MNTVLQQELIRFNKLLSQVRSSLQNLTKAIDGLLVMSAELDLVYAGIFDNKVPELWHKVAYPSLKPLASWVNDFVERLNEMAKWIKNDAPTAFWVSGFYFTQSFITGTLQNYARKYNIPIDTLSLDFIVIPQDSKEYNIKEYPVDGAYIYGLFFDGAQWGEKERTIVESTPGVLYS